MVLKIPKLVYQTLILVFKIPKMFMKLEICFWCLKHQFWCFKHQKEVLSLLWNWPQVFLASAPKPWLLKTSLLGVIDLNVNVCHWFWFWFWFQKSETMRAMWSPVVKMNPPESLNQVTAVEEQKIQILIYIKIQFLV